MLRLRLSHLLMLLILVHERHVLGYELDALIERHERLSVGRLLSMMIRACRGTDGWRGERLLLLLLLLLLGSAGRASCRVRLVAGRLLAVAREPLLLLLLLDAFAAAAVLFLPDLLVARVAVAVDLELS